MQLTILIDRNVRPKLLDASRIDVPDLAQRVCDWRVRERIVVVGGVAWRSATRMDLVPWFMPVPQLVSVIAAKSKPVAVVDIKVVQHFVAMLFPANHALTTS
jgi:hypothetical protein